jgi:hypothetical protein
MTDRAVRCDAALGNSHIYAPPIAQCEEESPFRMHTPLFGLRFRYDPDRM